ncbi:MAG: DUF1684 domain-containing protein [Chitinophagaceae bacterium]
MKHLFTIAATMLFLSVHGQSSYKDSIGHFIRTYVQNHEVIKGEDKKLFRFYPVDEHYRVAARFEKVDDDKWFTMETSGILKQTFRVYGTLHFSIHDTAMTLNIYQSQNLMNAEGYKDYLFLPFTDLTSGSETYTNGRYIDFQAPEIRNNTLVIDFNKAYNPYCAYARGSFNCPIPPKENSLPIAVHAGEKNFEGKLIIKE